MGWRVGEGAGWRPEWEGGEVQEGILKRWGARKWKAGTVQSLPTSRLRCSAQDDKGCILSTVLSSWNYALKGEPEHLFHVKHSDPSLWEEKRAVAHDISFVHLPPDAYRVILQL